MERKKADILIVEDDASILRGLLDFFVFNGYRAEGVEDGGAGLAKALTEAYDLIILDVMLPTMDGFSICRTVREQKPTQAIIMLTAKGAEEDVVTGFKAGADDYVGKPFSLRELMVRVEAVLRRSGKSLGDETIETQGLTFDGKSLSATNGDRVVEITRREMDMIAYLHHNQDRIVSKKDLLQDVWQYPDPDVETRTVDIHILKLRKKIAELDPDAQVIVTVRGEGYRFGN